MSRVNPEQPLQPSVLDRLIDHEPDVPREAPRSRAQTLRDMKFAVRRDLENLLNTRCRVSGWPPELEELRTSLVSYGIPDFTGMNLAPARQREAFRLMLEDAVRQFEPRFARVTVHLLENADQGDRALRFRIDAMLRVEPAPEPVAFDSALEPSTGTFEVRGGGQ